MKCPTFVLVALVCMGGLVLQPSIKTFISLGYAQTTISPVLVSQAEFPVDIIRDKASLITTRVFSVNPQQQEWDNGLILDNSASGTLIARKQIKQDKQSFYIYLVLTNHHVLSRYNSRYYIQTHDGLIHQAHQYSQTKLKNNDLGILWFYSPYEYKKATLGKSSNLKDNSKVFVAGFPCDLSSVEMYCPAKFFFSSGKVFLIDRPLVDGYQIGYTNDTKAGTSGGPVLNGQGQLVGINGRGKDDPASRQYRYPDNSGTPQITQEQSLALGIPIETYLQLAPKKPFNKILPEIKNIKFFNLLYEKNNTFDFSSSESSDFISKELAKYKIIVLVLVILEIFFMLICISKIINQKFNLNSALKKIEQLEKNHESSQELEEKLPEIKEPAKNPPIQEADFESN
ncbi:serine protease [Nostoc sp. ATCC 53789]|uniref:S1 family peptidase n=1 Tax=Nostoc sp. ATCC 53789 TaxID=76335 RepID=UPI00133195BD|nr:serine protease [Nostoc sp. ATCC 53789]